MSESMHRDGTIFEVISVANFLLHPSSSLRIESNNVFLDDELIISAEMDKSYGAVRVQRHIAMRSGTNPVLIETVGTIPRSTDDFENALTGCVEKALTGCSRLAIASHETALPAFLLGKIAFGSSEERRIEFLLRSPKTPEEIEELADGLCGRVDLSRIFKTIFNSLSLSPYTMVVDNLVALVVKIGGEFAIDTIGYMLRHLVRHLTAFDLVRFHNGGANYPDALMLDALLHAYIELAKTEPAKFTGPEARICRRALRQGLMIRRQYEGHAVPDSPTSPGDEQRLWPKTMAVSSRRDRRLYEGSTSDSLVSGIDEIARYLRDDLDVVEERRELGMATFLDRPLGIFKRPGEADRTPMLSYEAFSHRIAAARLKEFQIDYEISRVEGVAVARLAGHSREGVVALEDAKKAAMDFVFTRTTRSSLDEFLSQYDWPKCDAIDWLRTSPRVLLIRTPGMKPDRPLLTAYDESMNVRLEMSPAETMSPSYVEHCGREYLRNGIRVHGHDHIAMPII